MDNRTDQIREILNRLVRSAKLNNNEKEILYDTELAKFSAIERNGIVECIQKAIGNSAHRKRESVHLFALLHDLLNIQAIYESFISDKDPDVRFSIIQTIGALKLTAFVTVLNEHFKRETDPECKDILIYTLGELADESSFKIFEELARESADKYRMRLLWAFKNFARIESVEFLETSFKNDQASKHNRIVAAWALVKVGKQEYLDYLIKMLDDSDITTPTSHSPGVSLRAAQALS